MSTIAVYNLKGGVGKTSAAINLAVLAAAEGKRVLIWDLDPQGSASYFLESESARKNNSRKIIAGDMELGNAIQPTDYENLWVIPADLSASEADVILSSGERQTKKRLNIQLKNIAPEFDLVFLDSPPGISLLQQNIFTAADVILVPNIPTTLSIRSFDTILEYFREHGIPETKIKAFFSLVDNRKNLHHETIDAYRYNRLFLRSTIPYASDIEKMGIYQAPLASFAPNSTAAIAYYELWKELKRKLAL